MAYELVPDFRPAVDAHTFDTLASLALVLNYTGDVVLWGVVVADVRPGDPEDEPDPPVDRLAGRRRLGLRRG